MSAVLISRKEGESVCVGPVVVTIHRVGAKRVTVRVSAPVEMKITRREDYEKEAGAST